MIKLAYVILGSSSDLWLYALNALRNSPNRHCKKINTGNIMAILFNTYLAYPKLPIRDAFKYLPLNKSRQWRRRSVNSFLLIKSLLK